MRMDTRSGRAIVRLGALGCGIAALVALLLLPPAPAGPVVISVHNAGPDPVLVDARWWAGPVGVDGPIVRRIQPRSSLDITRASRRGEICVRVIETRSRRVLAGKLPDAGALGDSARVVVRRGDDGAPRPDLAVPCSPHLERDRVLVALGRSFEPGRPDRIRRERLIKRY